MMPIKSRTRTAILTLALTISGSAIAFKTSLPLFTDLPHSLAATPQVIASSKSWQNARLVKTFAPDDAIPVVSPNGQILATHRRLQRIRMEGNQKNLIPTNENIITLKRLDTGEEIYNFTFNSSPEFKSLLFSPDGQKLAYHTYNPYRETLTIRLWDVSTGQEMPTLRRIVKAKEVREDGTNTSSNPVIAFSPDGKSLINFSGANSTIYVWDITSQNLAAPKEKQKIAASLSLKNNQKAQAKKTPIEQAVQQDRQRFPNYEIQDYKIVKQALDVGKDFEAIKAQLRQQSKMVQHWKKTESADVYQAKTNFYVDLVTRLQAISYVHNKAVAILEELGMDTNDGQRQFIGEGFVIQSSDKNFLIADNNGQRSIMQIKDGSYNLNLTPSIQDINKVNSFVNQLLNQGKLRFALTGHTGQITASAVSRDGQFLVGGSLDKTIRVWNLTTGKPIHILKVSSNINSLMISPNNQWIISAEFDYNKMENNRIRFWDLKTGKLVRTVPVKEIINFHHFSADGKRLISLSNSPFISTQLQIWDVSLGKLVHQSLSLGDMKNSTLSIAISPDEKTYAIAGQERSFQVRDLMTDKTLINFGTEEYEVSYSADGNKLITIGREGVKIWQ